MHRRCNLCCPVQSESTEKGLSCVLCPLSHNIGMVSASLLLTLQQFRPLKIEVELSDEQFDIVLKEGVSVNEHLAFDVTPMIGATESDYVVSWFFGSMLMHSLLTVW
jgi:hypothetical protein